MFRNKILVDTLLSLYFILLGAILGSLGVAVYLTQHYHNQLNGNRVCPNDLSPSIGNVGETLYVMSHVSNVFIGRVPYNDGVCDNIMIWGNMDEIENIWYCLDPVHTYACCQLRC